MERFPCDGWLHITVALDSLEIAVTIKHDTPHMAYVNIALPEQWKLYIEQHTRSQTPGQIWQYIEQKVAEGHSTAGVKGKVPFQCKAVYYWWHVVSRQEWRLVPDSPLESAIRFVQKNEKKHHVQLLNIEAEPGTSVFAFQITDFIKEWARNTQELGMDSTWNTNGGNYELFAAVADVEGSGIPLAFLFIQTTKDAASGAKEKVLTRFLTALKELGVEPEYTLSDKDWSEINAMRTVWPKAKHQLCFWHALRTVKQRLAKTRERPGPYNGVEACEEFSFIDATFLPRAQCDPNDLGVSTYISRYRSR
ncbi:hypothetical protein K474DRAFT_1601490 [Panus rudis PR-1116 ss-1]|nr:hypothetical protein K474DRAFT_1601490 [Panus rudis PR-1116 ss-1]